MAVATVTFCIGGLFLAASVIFLLLHLSDLRALAALRRVRPAPVGTRGTVSLEAVTEYGQAGRQIGPVTGEDCAWFRVTLLREPARHGTDGPDVLLEVETPAWPAIADRTGRIPVDPRLLAGPRLLFDPIQDEARVASVTTLEHRRSAPVGLPPIVSPEVLADLRKSEKLRLIEVRVPRGLRVFALGRVTGSGLVPFRTGPTIVTPGTRAEVIAARRDSLRTGRAMMLTLFLAGLVLASASAAWLTA